MSKQADIIKPIPAVTNDELKVEDEGIYRYLGYFSRLGKFMRYNAYASEVGEAFRPVAKPFYVKMAYGISWTYVLGDVTYLGYQKHKENCSNEVIAVSVANRLVFQTLASMLLPALFIHKQVALSGILFRRIGRFQRWGPTVSGLMFIPLLPYIFDHPVEYVVDKTFDYAWPIKHI